MVATVVGLQNWSGNKSAEGHRDYMARWLIKTNDVLDGPLSVMTAGGLPQVGSIWDPWGWGIGNDTDTFAFCWPDWSCELVVANEPGVYWTLDQLFSTKPLKRCQDNPIDDPMLEPFRISGSFVKYMEERRFDRFGAPIVSTSHEWITGKSVEFDGTKAEVTIGMNFPTLPLSTYTPLMNKVNDDVMWGLPPRCIKLSGVRFTRVLYGSCYYYYSIDFEFEVDFRTFDRELANRGLKCLQGWAIGSHAAKLEPTDIDPTTTEEYYKNPERFEVYKDKNSENTQCWLDQYGRPVTKIADSPSRHTEAYDEADLIGLLGLPVTLA